MLPELFEWITPPPLRLRFGEAKLGGVAAMVVWLQLFPLPLWLIPQLIRGPKGAVVLLLWTVGLVVIARWTARLADRILSRIVDKW
jgi:hypothetical protein